MFRLILIGLLLSASPAIAQNNRSFVSGLGSDANSCTLTTPCRTFQRAHDVTNSGGEIAVLDTAGYGSIDITKSINIIAPDGLEAGVTVATTGISINAQVSDSITLRGLTISGAGSGTTQTVGIVFRTGGTLIVKNCVVTGLVSGIVVTATAPAGGGITTIVTDTVISNNTSAGLFFEPQGGGGSLSFERLQLFGNNTAIDIDGEFGTLVKAAGSDSTAAGNTSGFEVVNANLMLDNVKAVNNGEGIISGGNAGNVTLSRSVLFGNTLHGYDIQSGGFIKTLGDNRILQSNNSGTLTSCSSNIQ
jgi:hypothetical protein